MTSRPRLDTRLPYCYFRDPQLARGGEPFKVGDGRHRLSDELVRGSPLREGGRWGCSLEPLPRRKDEAGTDQKWVNSTIPFKLGDGASGPLVPVLAQNIGMSLSQIGLMEASFNLSSLMGGLLWGKASDVLRKRKAIIVLSFAATSLVLFLFAMSQNALEYVALRALHGFILAAFVAVSGALLIERSRRERFGEDMGHMNMVGGYAFLVGMVVASVAVGLYDVRFIFVMAAIFTLGSLALSVAMIKEPDAFLRRKDIHLLLSDHFVPALNAFVQRRLYNPSTWVQRPKFTPVQVKVIGYLLALFLAMLGGVATFALFPLLLLGPYGAGLTETVVVLLIGSLMSALLYRPVGKVADRVGFRKTLTLGLALRSAVFVLIALSLLYLRELWLISTINLLAGITWAFIMTTGPAALFKAVRVRRRGEMMGYYNVFMALGSTVGAAAGGAVAELLGFIALTVFSAVATGLSTVAVWRLNLD